MEIKVHVEHDPRFRGTAIYFYGKDNNGEFVIRPMEMVRAPYIVGEENMPTIVFSGHDGEEFLQSLAQELVRMGFKPDELKAKDGELSATKYHLEDMRNIAMKMVFPPIIVNDKT